MEKLYNLIGSFLYWRCKQNSCETLVVIYRN